MGGASGVNGQGQVETPASSTPPGRYDHIETMPDDKGGVVEVVESKDGTTNGELSLLAALLPDDIIRKILAKNGFALTEAAVSAPDVKWFREQVVGKVGGDNAKKFLKDEYINRLNTKLGQNNIDLKRAIFQDLGDSYHDPNGIGRLLDGDGLTDGVVEAWKETVTDISLRKNAGFLKDFSGILQKISGEFDGYTNLGHKIHVYYRNGEVTSFFFN